MATETLQKQEPQGGTIETWTQSYQSQWEISFAEIMYLIAEQYHMELTVEINGRQVPSPTLKFWRESLSELSPKQMREGLRLYMDSDRRSFKPAPGDLKANAPDATDKPRKVMNPKCPECSGSGFRKVLVNSKIHEGQKAQRVTDCFCVAIEYDGQSFKPEQKTLPAAPDIDPKELLQRIGKKTGVTLEKKFPQRREQSEADYNQRQNELRQQAETLLKGK
jgi:hypothetical protein